MLNTISATFGRAALAVSSVLTEFFTLDPVLVMLPLSTMLTLNAPLPGLVTARPVCGRSGFFIGSHEIVIHLRVITVPCRGLD
ncbi:hypothetical protein BJ322DRAFT_1058667 [Thelephora terrestris]|uniref:Uncharacterized protein n=1 Tax=Thelephora terrestris TaxID=56493 RepID=A0A9P6L759_9AGAM|nr:hypothetical protein BJ322DRAFT_1058667 [Thelephora terrestris]